MDASTIELFSHVLKVVAICNILSGMPASIKMWRTGDTQDWPTLFFIVGLVGSTGMVHYGVIVENSTLVLLNSFQALVNLYYIMIYILLSRSKTQTMGSLVLAVCYSAGIYSFAQYRNYDSIMLSNLLGSSSAIVFFFMNSVTILDVIAAQSKKRANYDLTMLGAGMINATLWLIYGLLLDDIYLYVPSLPFLFSGVLKIFQMFAYRSVTKKPAKKTE